ncbi:protein of unknown function [Cyanobium sp. NIES-981]|nr:protein of unknown function [Cyanobium sp. NIES-981]
MAQQPHPRPAGGQEGPERHGVMASQAPAQASGQAHCRAGGHGDHHREAQAGEAEPGAQQGCELGVAKTQGRFADQAFGERADRLEAQQARSRGQQMVEHQGFAHRTALGKAQQGGAAQAEQQPDPAEGFRQPQPVEIDQGEGNQPAQQQPPRQHLPWPPGGRAHGLGRGEHRRHPQAGGEQFHQGVARRDGGVAVTAAAPDQQPPQHGDVVVPAQAGAAARAVAGGMQQRFLAGLAPGHHIEKTADAGPQHTGGPEPQSRHGRCCGRAGEGLERVRHGAGRGGGTSAEGSAGPRPAHAAGAAAAGFAADQIERDELFIRQEHRQFEHHPPPAGLQHHTAGIGPRRTAVHVGVHGPAGQLKHLLAVDTIKPEIEGRGRGPPCDQERRMRGTGCGVGNGLTASDSRHHLRG